MNNSSSRPHLVQAKQTWFAAEPVVVHAGRQWDAGLVLAAPLTATRVGAYWVDLVVRTETRGGWRSVFAGYERCTPNGLLLGPQLRDIDARDIEDGEDPVPDEAAWSSGDDPLYDGGTGLSGRCNPRTSPTCGCQPR